MFYFTCNHVLKVESSMLIRSTDSLWSYGLYRYIFINNNNNNYYYYNREQVANTLYVEPWGLLLSAELEISSSLVSVGYDMNV